MTTSSSGIQGTSWPVTTVVTPNFFYGWGDKNLFQKVAKFAVEIFRTLICATIVFPAAGLALDLVWKTGSYLFGKNAEANDLRKGPKESEEFVNENILIPVAPILASEITTQPKVEPTVENAKKRSEIFLPRIAPEAAPKAKAKKTFSILDKKIMLLREENRQNHYRILTFGVVAGFLAVVFILSSIYKPEYEAPLYY